MTKTRTDWPELEDLDTVTAWDYLRVSLDESGIKRSNTEQHTDNVAIVTRKRWTLGETFEDVGSASKFARKGRPGFDDLVARLRGGGPVADVLVLWEPSRGSREVDVWHEFLKLCAKRGMRIYVTTLHRLFLPWLSSDWGDLMRFAVKSAEESMQTSERVGRSTRADATNGHVHGGRRAYGYAKAGGAIDLDEATVIRECVRRVLAGDTVRAIAADLNRRRIATVYGKPWHPGSLAQMLRGKRIAGIRTHKGTVVARGTWPAIITEAEHRRLCAVLADRTPVGRRGREPWLLTGFLLCGRCGATMVGNTDIGGTRRYICRKAPGYNGCGGLGIKAEPLEQLLGFLVTNRLADVEARRNVDDADDSSEFAELDRIAAKRVEIADDYANDRISRETRLTDTAALDRRQRAIETAIAAKVHANAPLDYVITENFIGTPWADHGIEDQRVALRATINTVTVAPASKRGSNTFEAARVTGGNRIDWKI